MPKKKRTKKNKVIARSDTNENARKSLAEKERVSAALLKKRGKLIQEYKEEMERRKKDEEMFNRYMENSDFVEP